MTDNADIERLLQMTGRTLEGLPRKYGFGRLVQIDQAYPKLTSKANHIAHQSDVIELLVGALRDALDKPLQEPLTLEDVLKIDDYGEAWWVEYEAGFVTPTILNNDYHQYGEQLLDGFSVKLFDYGKTWRCWASRPTDEERDAAEWEV